MFRSRLNASYWPQAIVANESGAVAVIFALALVTLAGTAGMAVDYSVALSKETMLQEALDAAVLAGVATNGSAEKLSGRAGGPAEDERLNIANSFFETNRAELPHVDSIAFQFEGDILSGHASAHVETSLLQVLGIKTIDIAVVSKATSAPTRAPLCFMALHPTRKHTLELKDSVSVIAPDCHIYGNSDNFDDVVDPHTLENFLVGKSVQAIGFGHHYLQNVSPPLEHAPELIPDPLAAMAMLAPVGCDQNNIVVSGGARFLNPGSYCGGLTISNGAVVTFSPGLYTITGGKFVVSDAEISGDEVTISLADNGVEIEWTNSTIRLSAPKTGQYAGVVMMGVRAPTNHNFIGSTIDLHGLVYLPNGAVTWWNTGTPVITSKWTAWIVDGVSWEGDGTLNINFNLKDSDIPYPTGLNVIPRPGSPRLVL